VVDLVGKSVTSIVKSLMLGVVELAELGLRSTTIDHKLPPSECTLCGTPCSVGLLALWFTLDHRLQILWEACHWEQGY